MTIKNIETITDEDYVEYIFTHKDDSTGSASLTIRELDSTHHITYIIRDEHIPYGFKVAELFFYPNSETSGERKGVGSLALDFIINDAQERGIKVVYVEVTNVAAQQFFQKKGFKGNLEPYGYVVIS